MDPNWYCDNFIYEWEYLGLETPMIPRVNEDSSARIAMASKNAQQWEMVHGAEHARQYTGIESMYGEYTFDTLPIDQDVIVRKVLTKYGEYYGEDYKINDNRMLQVIYEGVDDKKIGCFDVPSYRYLSRAFGYFTKLQNKHLIQTGARISKKDVIYHSPVKDGNLYKMGVNANTAYVSWLPTSDDACIISKSLAKKLTVTRFYRFSIPITEDMVPCNIFGSADGEHKFFPDIGEQIGPDGILAVLRPISPESIFDYTEDNLRVYNPLHDIPYRATPGATVVDINVYTNPYKWDIIRGTDKDGPSAYTQLAKYQYHLYQHYRKFLNFYDENPSAKYTEHMTSLLAKYALLMPGEDRPHGYNGIMFKKNRAIFDKDTPIPLCILEITIAVDEVPERGAKITGRHGNKGVVSAVWEDEWMPVDKWGIRADIILNDNAIVSRMNNGQLGEHNFNRLSDLVVIDSMHMGPDEAYDYIINYLMDMDPKYGELVHKQTSWRKAEFIKFVRQHGIYINVPVTRQHYTEEHTMFMNKKWGYRESQVKWTYPISPNKLRTAISAKPMAIGSTYIFLINKIPTTNAVELGYVSQMGLPIKNAAAKVKFISQTAIRFGEDEIRIMMISVKAKVLARFLNVCGNSPQDAREIYWRGLTDPNPCAFRRLDYDDEEIAERSIPIRLVQHIFASAGIDITKRAIYEDDNP